MKIIFSKVWRNTCLNNEWIQSYNIADECAESVENIFTEWIQSYNIADECAESVEKYIYRN